MPLETGSKLGAYEILGMLGQGGMGEVYRARDARLERDVAIKVLPAKFAEDAVALSRFEREAKAVAALAHPNIVAIYDFGSEGGQAYAAMELVEGETLRERLEQGALPAWKAVELSRQVASALGAAHEGGIAHRDLKPENIFIDRQGQAKVLDFGLAAPLGEADESPHDTPTRTSLTAPGTVMGSMGYMSPEQVRGITVDHRTDIFSFGCVLQEMLTGDRAFRRETAAETMTAILREEPAEVETTTGALSPALWRVVRRCLEKNPDERFQSARDLAFAIDNSTSVTDSQQFTVSAATDASPPKARFGWAVGALIAVLGVVAGLALATAFRSPAAIEPVRVRTLTVSGSDREPTASPDGRMVAFTSTRDGVPRIWIKQLAGGGEEPLTAGPDSFPSFSPDGSTVLFQRDEGRVMSTYRQALVGGQPRKIATNAMSPSWSPDGERVAFLRGRMIDAQTKISIVIADVQTGDERLLGEYASGMQGPVWSPDGKTLLVVESSVTGNSPDYRLLLLDIESGEVERREVGDGRPFSLPIWMKNGDMTLALSGSLLGDQGSSSSRFVRYSPASSELATLFWTEHLFPLSGLRTDFSRAALVNSTTLVYHQIQGRQNLREVRLDDGSGPGVGQILTRGEGRDRQPVYSPDGRRVVFSSNRAGNLDLWTLDLDDGNYRQLTDDAAQDWDPCFTPDGEEIVWSSDRSGHLEIWIASADGSNSRQLSQDGVDAENPSVTGNDEWVVYWSANPEKQGMWKIRRDGSDATKLLSGSILFAETSPDGRYAAYLSIETSELRNVIRFVDIEYGDEVPFRIEVPTPMGAQNMLFGRPRWLPDGSGIAYVGIDEQNRTGIYAQDFVPGSDTSATRRPLAGFSSELTTESFGISPDGRRIMLAVMEESARLMLAEGIPLL